MPPETVVHKASDDLNTQRAEVPPTPDEVEGEYIYVLQEIANSR
jgi:hypothetical protein